MPELITLWGVFSFDQDNVIDSKLRVKIGPNSSFFGAVAGTLSINHPKNIVAVVRAIASVVGERGNFLSVI